MTGENEMNLLIPKVPVALSWIVAAGLVGVSASYHDTITLGSILVSAIVIVIGGIFTIRNNLKSFWKNLAEERSEQVKVLEEHLKDAADKLAAAELRHTEQMAGFAEEQREVRHTLKNELAEARIQLEAERAKHDISSLVSRLEVMEETLATRTPVFTHMEDLLEEIAEALRPPITAKLVDPGPTG